MISIEDLTCDRLGSWGATGRYDSWAQAVRLAENETTDQERLARRAAELRLDQYLVFGLYLQAEGAAGRLERGDVARYVHEFNTDTAVAVIEHLLRDRGDRVTRATAGVLLNATETRR